jgi:hypothetical protein
MNGYRALPQVLLACALVAGVAACGSSGSSSASKTHAATASSSSATASSSATPSTMSATESAIAKNWTAFFSAKTPVAERIRLLQDGQMFAPVIKAQAKSSLAAGASAKVTKVTLVSPTQARVTYTILLNGQPALSNQTGVAVLQGGTWKVGIASFCSLLALENGGKTSSLPAACKTAA